MPRARLVARSAHRVETRFHRRRARRKAARRPAAAPGRAPAGARSWECRKNATASLKAWAVAAAGCGAERDEERRSSTGSLTGRRAYHDPAGRALLEHAGPQGRIVRDFAHAEHQVLLL